LIATQKKKFKQGYLVLPLIRYSNSLLETQVLSARPEWTPLFDTRSPFLSHRQFAAALGSTSVAAICAKKEKNFLPEIS